MTDFRSMTTAMVDRLRADPELTGVQIGEQAPRFVLPDAAGGKVSLDDRLADGTVVLSFYRGAWCPICNAELRGLQEALPRIRELGASLIAVSPQAPDVSRDLVARLDLGFDVLSDADQSVTRAYRLQFQLDERLRAVYEQMGMSPAKHNADGTWNLPVPATFVIDRAAVVRARHVDPDYRQRMTVDDLLDALRARTARRSWRGARTHPGSGRLRDPQPPGEAP